MTDSTEEEDSTSNNSNTSGDTTGSRTDSSSESAPENNKKTPLRRRTLHTYINSDRSTSTILSGDDDQDSDQDESSSTNQRLKQRGISLRTKLILLVLIAQVFSAAFMYALSMYQTREALTKEIDSKGSTLVRALSSFEPNYLKQIQGIKGRPGRDLKRAFYISGSIVQRMKKFIQEQTGSGTAEAFIDMYDQELQPEISNKIDQAFERMTGSSRSGENSFLNPIQKEDFSIKYIDFRYIDKSTGRTEPVYTVPSEDLTISSRSPVTSHETETYTIEISQANINNSPVRIYKLTRPLSAPEKNQMNTGSQKDRRYQVLLALSSQEISRATGQLTYTLLLVTFLSVLCGGGAGWFFSGRIIGPINALLADIDEVSKGNLDHETEPQSTDEIGVIARTFNRMTKNLKTAQKRELEVKAMEHELNIAMEVQGELLPDKHPDISGWDIGSTYKPSKEVGGDYYDFIQIDEDHIGLVVADVSGKGVPGSLVMTMTRAMIRMEGSRNVSTKETLIRTNRMLAKDIREGMFVTCIYAILNIPESRLRISSAGHNPMVLWRNKEKQLRTVNPNGIALGFDKGPLFERTIVENVIELNKGDRIVLYTDGVVEAMSPDDEEFGKERFYKLTAKLARQTSEKYIETVIEKISRHQQDGEQHDDITILTARRMA